MGAQPTGVPLCPDWGTIYVLLLTIPRGGGLLLGMLHAPEAWGGVDASPSRPPEGDFGHKAQVYRVFTDIKTSSIKCTQTSLRSFIIPEPVQSLADRSGGSLFGFRTPVQVSPEALSTRRGSFDITSGAWSDRQQGPCTPVMCPFFWGTDWFMGLARKLRHSWPGFHQLGVRRVVMLPWAMDELNFFSHVVS